MLRSHGLRLVEKPAPGINEFLAATNDPDFVSGSYFKAKCSDGCDWQGQRQEWSEKGFKAAVLEWVEHRLEMERRSPFAPPKQIIRPRRRSVT